MSKKNKDDLANKVIDKHLKKILEGFFEKGKSEKSQTNARR